MLKYFCEECFAVLKYGIYVGLSPLIVVAWSPQYHHHYENNGEQEWP